MGVSGLGERGLQRALASASRCPRTRAGSLRSGGIAPGASPPGTERRFGGKEAVLQHYVCTMPGVTGSWDKPLSTAAMQGAVR